jgi:hypothetical protein
MVVISGNWSITSVPNSAAVDHAAVAGLLAAFPDRAIALTPKASNGLAKGLTILAVIALIPVLVVGWLLLGELALHRDLGDRGVVTSMLDWDRSCTSTARTGTVCHGVARYAIRPEHGGGTREAKVSTHTRHILAPVIYDPQNPDRVLAVENLEEGPLNGYYFGTSVPLGASVLLAGFAIAATRRDRRRAAARGRPALAPVTSATRHAKQGKGDWEETDVFFAIDYQHPGSKKPRMVTFPEASPPFLLARAPPGQPGAADILALALDHGEIVPLDRGLTYLDLSDAERQAILQRAAASAPVAEAPASPAPAPPPKPVPRVAEAVLGRFRWRLPTRTVVRRREQGLPHVSVRLQEPTPIALLDLLRLVQQQSGPSVPLDLQIFTALFGLPGYFGYNCHAPKRPYEYYDDERNHSEQPPYVPTCPTFTADIESAEQLIPPIDRSWRLESSGETNICEISFTKRTFERGGARTDRQETGRGTGKTVPLAICAAVIAYYADQRDGTGREGDSC